MVANASRDFFCCATFAPFAALAHLASEFPRLHVNFLDLHARQVSRCAASRRTAPGQVIHANFSMSLRMSRETQCANGVPPKNMSASLGTCLKVPVRLQPKKGHTCPAQKASNQVGDDSGAQRQDNGGQAVGRSGSPPPFEPLPQLDVEIRPGCPCCLGEPEPCLRMF
jgi:hypothetical protein